MQLHLTPASQSEWYFPCSAARLDGPPQVCQRVTARLFGPRPGSPSIAAGPMQYGSLNNPRAGSACPQPLLISNCTSAERSFGVPPRGRACLGHDERISKKDREHPVDIPEVTPAWGQNCNSAPLADRLTQLPEGRASLDNRPMMTGSVLEVDAIDKVAPGKLGLRDHLVLLSNWLLVWCLGCASQCSRRSRVALVLPSSCSPTLITASNEERWWLNSASSILLIPSPFSVSRTSVER